MAAPRAYAVGGAGSAPTLEDVVRVAAGQQVALDSAGAERIKKESPPPKAFEPESDQLPGQRPAPNGEKLEPRHARAVLLTRLLSIMNGRSGCRLQLAEFLASLLNSGGALPLLAGTEAQVMHAVADACKGAGDGVADALRAAGVEAVPEISATERSVLASGSSASAGIGALAVTWGRAAVGAATAVAALSCEAYGAPTKEFEADVVEAGGHKAAAAAADQLRGLLEGSKCAGTLKGASPQQLALFSNLPQLLGSASDALSSAYAAVRAEVQSSALPAVKGSATLAASPMLASTLADSARALLAIAAASLARAKLVATAAAAAPIAEVAQRADGAVERPLAAARSRLAAVYAALLDAAVSPEVAGDGAAGQQGPLAALATDTAVSMVVEAASLEALAALAALRIQQGPPPTDNTTTAAAAAQEQEQGGKAAAKKKGKRGASGLVLGKGSAIVRTALEAAAAGVQPAEDSAAADPNVANGSAPPLPAPALPLAEGGGGLADGFDAGLAAARLAGALDPREPGLGRLLEELRAVVEANQARRKPKVAKGARDFLPDQMAIREATFARITGVFKRHGAVSIDTPVFELRETLTGKYGEDSKLIYDLADQGGELLSLRYDLTVPFARYVAVNGVGNIKRYHIGKVYRRDQPAMNRGRFREFFQCDFDIAGVYPAMVPEAEVLKVVVEVLDDLALGPYEVKLNHRGLLDAMMAIAGVPSQKFRAICSSIDKLDKESWEAVRREMTEDKGLPAAAADKIGEFVVLRGEPKALLAQLTTTGHPLAQDSGSAATLAELGTLFGYLEAMGALGRIVFDLSLARGLDYYTGVIYEAVLLGANVGSIAGGGRYDKLVGMFSGKDVPAVGVSIGIERVFSIMEAQLRELAKEQGAAIRATETQVLVASIGNGLQIKRMELAARLWAAGIKAEFGYKPNPKMGDQLGYALEQGVPLMVLFGEDELARGEIKVKDMAAKTEEAVALDALVDTLKARVATLPGGLLMGAGGQQQQQPSSSAAPLQ